jgi:hypothetical protein
VSAGTLLTGTLTWTGTASVSVEVSGSGGQVQSAGGSQPVTFQYVVPSSGKVTFKLTAPSGSASYQLAVDQYIGGAVTSLSSGGLSGKGFHFGQLAP